VTYRRNTASFERCDLVPNVLRGVESVDMSVTVMGQRLAMPFYCSPTALQRLFHHQGERAVAAAAAKYGTMFGVSSLGTVSLEELRKEFDTPQVYQFYFHKDRGLNRAMMQRAKDAGINVLMLTVDSITGGKPRTRPAHRVLHSFSADPAGNAPVRDQTNVGPQLRYS
jgi:L-lactate dehydrogenase (cytochrome)